MNIRYLAAIAIPLGVIGCANPTVSRTRDTVALPAYTAPQSVQKPVPLPKVADSYRMSDSGRSYSLTLKNADLPDVLQLLSKESGIPIVAERGLKGYVQIEAKNRKLGELLYTILKPLGYTASVENGIILVGRPKLTTRTFRVNYLKDRRSSSSNMNVSGFSAGSVSVSSVGQSDFWGALENSLEMLVFGTSGKGKRDGGGFSISENEKKSDGKGSQSSSLALSKVKPETVQELNPEDPLLSSSQITEGQLKQLVVNEIAGIIQITDFSENLDKIASFLTDVEEGSRRQVLIQAHIMEISLKDYFSMGIDWKYIFDKTTNLTLAQALVPATPANIFKISAAGNDFAVLLDAMKEQGNVNMLSSPKITALNNQKAVIKLTTKQVSWVSSKTTQNNAIGGQDTYTTTPQIDEVGIFLDVTPQIGPDNSITMQIHPSVSEIKEISSSPDKTSTKPVIDIREIDTMVDAKAGETIVIAGLISDKLNETKRGVPFLGDIPYLGAIFSYNKQERTKTELVIMMTPYVLNPKNIDEIRAEHELRLRNMGGDFHLINNLGSMVTEKSSRDWIMNSEPHRQKTPAAPESVAPARSESGISGAAPEQKNAATHSTQQVENQQLEIKRLEQAVKTAQEQLTDERRKNVALAEEALRPARPAIEQKAVKFEVMPTVTVVPPIAPGESNSKVLPQELTQSLIANVQTTSATTSREQTLYRSAVVAYKIGDCKESIKSFDRFLAMYPFSPFAQDAAYYRKDCAERK